MNKNFFKKLFLFSIILLFIGTNFAKINTSHNIQIEGDIYSVDESNASYCPCLAMERTSNDDHILTVDNIEAMRVQGEKEEWTFTVGETSAVYRSIDELCGLIIPDDLSDYNSEGSHDFVRTDDLPSRFDWRDPDYNYLGRDCVTPIKDQSHCGSCWAFGVMATLESNILMNESKEVDLSEQWLISCTDAGSCLGGWLTAYDYLAGKSIGQCNGFGAVLEEACPYVAYDAPCNCPYVHRYLIRDWGFVMGNAAEFPSVNMIKNAMYNYGPIAAGVYVTDEFIAYTGGVFNKNVPKNAHHLITLVGWDDDQGENGVWFLRNSWGLNWGEDKNGVPWDQSPEGGGYMRIEYNFCSVGQTASYMDGYGQFHRSRCKLDLKDVLNKSCSLDYLDFFKQIPLVQFLIQMQLSK